MKTGKNERKKREDGREKSQRLLLTWLVEQPKLFRTISAYLSPSDFTEGVYRKVAEELFRQMKEEGQPNPGRIVTMFDSEEDQRTVAQICNASAGEMESSADMEKALSKESDPADPAGKSGGGAQGSGPDGYGGFEAHDRAQAASPGTGKIAYFNRLGTKYV